MTKLYILFEHFAGYAIFKVKDFEEIGTLSLPQLKDALQDLRRFNSMVQLVGFSPFNSAVSALENMNALSEGILTDELKQFLDITIPKSNETGKYMLGVSEPKLSASIQEALQITCTHLGAVPQIIRAIRHHFHNVVNGLTTRGTIAQVGLGFSYSRAKLMK